MNDPFFIAIAALLLLLLVLFIVFRNKADLEKLKNKLNKEYRKPKHHRGDAEQDLSEEKI